MNTDQASHHASHAEDHPDGAASAADHGHGLVVVVSGPSGVGKTTIVRRLIDELDAVFSVSATTRAPRAGETDGVDYQFISRDRFLALKQRGEFLEHAEVFGRDLYGTPRGPVEELLKAGRIVMLDIDVQGALQVRGSMPQAMLMFIAPPQDSVLLDRLRGRGKDDEQTIQRRFHEAQQEIATARNSNAYDVFIVNDDLEQAVQRARQAIAERVGAR